MTWGAPLLMLLGGLWLQPARAGSHYLRYFYSSLSGPLPGIPQFSSFGYLDDVPIVSYTSGSFREETRTPWMESITAKDPQYWELQTNICRREEHGFKTKLWKMMEEVNQTRRLYMFQRIFGCELREDNSIRGFDQYAVDGQDFISFDKDRLTYRASMDAAKITQDRWNSEKGTAQYWKGYLEGRCIEDLKKYLKLGEERLQRVAPQTMVSRRKNGDRTFLTGYAYGFYPRDIEVRWVRNGVEMPWESKMILPNPDGTYQARATVEVQAGDNENIYSYEVYHSSLADTVTVMYEEKSPPMVVIIAVVIGALVGVGLIAVVVWFVYSKINMPGRGPEGEDINQPLQQGENI